MRLDRAVLIIAFLLSACGGNKSTAPTAVTLLDATVALVAGQNCNIGGMSRDFSGTANTRVTVMVAASGLNLTVVLYSPDFTTQIAAATGSGSATINQSLTLTGTHHVTFCEVNGLAGNVRVTVTQS
jgi:hypothetical protein